MKSGPLHSRTPHTGYTLVLTAVQWPVGGKRTSLHASQPTSSRLTVHSAAVRHSLSIVPHTDRLDLLLSVRLTLFSTIISLPTVPLTHTHHRVAVDDHPRHEQVSKSAETTP